MPGTFYSGQTDYIAKLNEMYDYYVPVTIASTSSSQSLDISQGKVFNTTLGSSATTTFTFTNAPSGYCSIEVFVKQNSAGSKVALFSGTIKWEGNSTPTQTATANYTDIWTFKTYNGGTTWFGRRSANYPA